ncbi:hypothetical protein uan_040 [Pseudomonas phage UAntarctica]|nr:hypothetical protein uan_040 [Pseudomonas phage UAntarctica]
MFESMSWTQRLALWLIEMGMNDPMAAAMAVIGLWAVALLLMLGVVAWLERGAAPIERPAPRGATRNLGSQGNRLRP